MTHSKRTKFVDLLFLAFLTYFSELETALSEYADLKEQSTDFEPAELYAQRSLPPHLTGFSLLMAKSMILC